MNHVRVAATWLVFALLTLTGGDIAFAQNVFRSIPVDPDRSVKPRILLIHDMEGLSGQDDPYSFLYGHPAYELGRQLLLEDVNAVIAGLFAGGASSVAVADGHGSGNPQPDLPVERLDPRAQMISRPPPFDVYLDLAAERDFDALVLVGMHAKSGSGGFAPHTYTIGMDLRIGGHSVTEPELLALMYGSTGVPVIFVSGDDRLALDLKTMPWIEFVTTKRATSPSTVELLPVGVVRAALRHQAQRAVKRIAEARVLQIPGPIQVSVQAVPPATISWMSGLPGINYEDETVSFTAENVTEGYRGLRPLITAIGFSFSDALLSAFNAQPQASQLRQRGTEELFRRWLQAEAAR